MCLCFQRFHKRYQRFHNRYLNVVSLVPEIAKEIPAMKVGPQALSIAHEVPFGLSAGLESAQICAQAELALKDN